MPIGSLNVAMPLLATVAGKALVLRDVHVPPAPSWFPPAYGWWIAFVLVVGTLVATLLWRARRRRRLREALQRFERAIAVPDAAAQVGAIAELLRRAARAVDPASDALQGDAWLRFLDGHGRRAGTAFTQGPGRLLLDGGYRRDVPRDALHALVPVARERYLALLRGER